MDSHPYSTDTTADGVYVGEAAGNDILWVANDGKIKTVAVLPPTPVTITAEARRGQQASRPAPWASSYWFEPVPTDVELGTDGWLYVSSLPGGPEDGSTGPQGRVYKVNPASPARSMLVAGGFISTVNVAVAGNGDVYVAELFAGHDLADQGGQQQGQAVRPGDARWARSSWRRVTSTPRIDALIGDRRTRRARSSASSCDPWRVSPRGQTRS